MEHRSGARIFVDRSGLGPARVTIDGPGPDAVAEARRLVEEAAAATAAAAAASAAFQEEVGAMIRGHM